MNKKVFILLILINFVALLSKAQCNDYQYHILESVSNLYDVSDNTYDSFIMIRSAFEAEDYNIMKEYADSAKDYIELLKSTAYNARTSIELAYNTAEMCYCLNGQKATGNLSDKANIIYDNSKEISKIYKKSLKTSDKEIAKRYIFQIMELLERTQVVCDKASKDCVNAQEACY
ncbi:MAG: hypothetical protein RBR97_11220 [Bacteroidales bacterium]|jgi:hypothetical protein|nr:hypothetical protein [Bacteroidales bacterium]